MILDAQQRVEVVVANNEGAEYLAGTVLSLHPSTDEHEDFYRVKVRLDDGRELPNVHPDAVFPIAAGPPK